ncbi:glycosyltransferase [Parvibaculum sp.]|uniref:glycosyltransferase n=1 Tax=Parvibaculum sp. TaxID=2024848 RepID=UPI001B27ACC8|nr:glycosyltransferase [Parvibaculum sp.]MBO6679276.1 hypothetical protein [Parvibaculum sp.]MBO6685407.1 hypothetical protein [Parvibaculum sp.]
MASLCLIAAVNNDVVLEQNLASSALVRKNPDILTTMRNYSSASAAYNAGLDRTSTDIAVFAHQDVYLPQGWEDALLRNIAVIEETDPGWGVIGVYGVRDDGGHAGRVWSSGLNRELDTGSKEPVKASSVDELLIVLRRGSGLRFDEDLPGFHMYGTDICQESLERGHGVYVVNAPVVHNSVPVFSLAGGYTDAYCYMRRKWRHRLPVKTTVTTITPLSLSFLYLKWRIAGFSGRRARLRRSQTELMPRESAPDIAQLLGYE